MGISVEVISHYSVCIHVLVDTYVVDCGYKFLPFEPIVLCALGTEETISFTELEAWDLCVELFHLTKTVPTHMHQNKTFI